uniref:Uncharacterized protein n=1 Tax=Glossina palpalis gambiensis TaxID=67801 RepID=A0A1B0AN57_9MUSC
MRESRDMYWLLSESQKSKVFNDTEKVEIKIMENEKWLQEITFVCLLNGSKNMMSAVEITTRAGVGLLEFTAHCYL